MVFNVALRVLLAHWRLSTNCSMSPGRISCTLRLPQKAENWPRYHVIARRRRSPTLVDWAPRYAGTALFRGADLNPEAGRLSFQKRQAGTISSGETSFSASARRRVAWSNRIREGGSDP